MPVIRAWGLATIIMVQFYAANAAQIGPTPDEMADKELWIKMHFQKAPAVKEDAGLHVLANNDAVAKNGRNNKPLRIADKEYTHGLFCHAISKVLVHLPSGGRSFTATAGVDSNEQTRPGKGSVVFSVNIDGKEAFKSPVMHEGMPGVPVSTDLAGATSFLLEVGDAGDGIACDQADWADAKVVLSDGKELWLADLPLNDAASPVPSGPPFTFTYASHPSTENLSAWERTEESKDLDAARVQHTLVWTDPKTGLAVRCVAVEYRDFPTVEWTLFFKNTGAQDTPILENIQALDINLQRNTQGEFLLHHNAGSQANADDYRPLETPLGVNARLQLGSSGGRGSDGVWPYFNIDTGSGQGTITAIGWPGQWTGMFARDGHTNLHIQAGQQQTHFKLLPGEEVRSPLIVLQFWRGDWIGAQNIWRRWMLAHNLPRPGGHLPSPLLPAASSNQCNEMQNANEENQIAFIDGYIQNGVKIDFWWMDAGWYTYKEGWWNVGTWEVDKKRFPNGLRAVSDHAHSKGVKTLLWFEPERVTPGTWLYTNYPEWLLGGNGQRLLDLGNPLARQWVIEHITTLMKDEGIDIYRQDFNFAPLDYWRGHDAPDRQGISEIRHVTGYLAFWDELRRLNPDLLIDTCASGGRRNDLETLRRSVPLHKSDMEYSNLTSKQTQLFGLAFWAPFFGAPVYPADHVDVYGFRSGIAPMTGLGYDSRRKDLDYALLRKLVAEWREVSPNFFGDYYPLTSWSSAQDVWIAWQFDRPEVQQGMVQAFRRPQSIYESARFKLRGLDAEARYVLTNADVPVTTEATGKELMEKGVAVSIPEARGAVIITYKQAGK